MMQSMRDKTQGIIAGVIAVLIAVTFVLWGVQNYLGSGSSNIVAKVNGAEITKEQLRLVYEQSKRIQMLQLGADFLLDQKAQSKLKEQILQDLIDREILYQAETKMGLGVSTNQLLAMINGMPIFQVKGVFSPARFQQMVSRMYRSEQSFFSEIERSTMKVQLEKGIKDTAFVLSSEIKTIKNIFKQRRDFGYFKLSPRKFLKGIKVSDKDIKGYYQDHQKEFLLPEKVSIQYVELTSGDFKSSVKPTEQQYKTFYDSHIDSFSSPKKWQVTKILLPLSASASHKSAEAADKEILAVREKLNANKDFIKGLDSKFDVNTLWLSLNELPRELVNNLNKLSVGEISEPFRTQDGYNLIKVLAIKQPQAEPYAKVKVKVRKLYDRNELNKVFTEASDKLSDLVYTNSDSLQPAADELILKIKETEFFTSEGGKKGITANNKVVKTAFSDVVLNQRYNSSLVELEPGRVLVLRIKEHIPERTQSLSKVRAMIVKKLEDQKAKEKAKLVGEEILQRILRRDDEAKIAAKYGLSWRKVAGVDYNQGMAKNKHKLVKAAFDLLKSTDGAVSARLVDLDDGYAAIRLDNVYSVQNDKESHQEKNFIRSLPRVFGSFGYRSLLNYIKQHSEIVLIGDKQER